MMTGTYNYGCARLETAIDPPRAYKGELTFSSTSDLAIAVTLELIGIQLPELITLRRVSRQWKRVIETLCRGRRSLKLFGWDYDRHERDVLFSPYRQSHLNSLEPSSALFLARLFPEVVSLSVFCYERYMATVFLAIFPKWQAKLVKLSISGLPKNKSLETKVINAVKSMPKLAELSIFGLRDNLVPTTLPKKMPVLYQLETLMLEGYLGDITPYLVQLGPSIRKLFIDSDHKGPCTTAGLAKFLEANPKVGSALQYGHFNVVPDESFRMLEIICTRFPLLKNLDVSFLFGLNFGNTLPLLSNLKNLRKVNFNPDLRKGYYPEIHNLSPLDSVQQLFLGTVADSTYSVADFKETIGIMFPELEEIRIASFSPKFVKELKAEVKGIFPKIKEHQIGLANRNKLRVGVRKGYGDADGDEEESSEEEVICCTHQMVDMCPVCS